MCIVILIVSIKRVNIHTYMAINWLIMLLIKFLAFGIDTPIIDYPPAGETFVHAKIQWAKVTGANEYVIRLESPHKGTRNIPVPGQERDFYILQLEKQGRYKFSVAAKRAGNWASSVKRGRFMYYKPKKEHPRDPVTLLRTNNKTCIISGCLKKLS